MYLPFQKTLDELKSRIRGAIDLITVDMTQLQVYEKFDYRFDVCRAIKGGRGHIDHL